VEVLPSNYTAYFEPQGLVDETDGSKVICSFVSIGGSNDLDSILITLVTEEESMYAFRTMNLGTLTEDRQTGQTVNDLCRRYEEESKVGKEPKMHPSIGVSDHRLLTESICLRTILNAVLYVNNPNEEFEEQLNKFATKKSKLEIQKKVLCQKPFHRIGFKNAEHLKLVLEREVSVKWHFRTQHYGKGNKLTKRILIADYTKNLKRNV
jgi:hypothetical protein